MSNDETPAKVLDWKALMQEAKRDVEEKAKLRQLTTKDLEGAINSLRHAALAHVSNHADKPEAAEVAQYVAHAVQFLAFVLGELHMLAQRLRAIEAETDKRRLILQGMASTPRGAPPEWADLNEVERSAVAQKERMSIGFHRACAMVAEWFTFSWRTGLLPAQDAFNLHTALADLSEGEMPDMLRHPNPKRARRRPQLHIVLECSAVSAVEALMRAETLDAVAAGKTTEDKPPRAVRKVACNVVAQYFAGYDAPSGRPVTPDMIEDWHDKHAWLLREGETGKPEAAKEMGRGLLSLWRSNRDRLLGLDPDTQATPGDSEADRLERLAFAWCDSIRDGIEHGLIAMKSDKPRVRASKQRRETPAKNP
jgi:hypothetical protein